MDAKSGSSLHLRFLRLFAAMFVQLKNPMPFDEHHRTRTLWLCTLLHAFSHIYTVALLPLYLLIVKDLGLKGEGQATFLMTALGVMYCLASYPLGILADRVNRRLLLGAGLVLNGLAFVGLGLARSYGWAVAWCAVAGLAGSFYHPAGTAMLAELYPTRRGKALGVAGMGAAFGFWLAPTYTGWRAEAVGWRVPVMELGLLGLVAAAAFMVLLPPQPPFTPHPAERQHLHASRSTVVFWALILLLGLLFSLRDFAGAGMSTLSSLFLQHAWHYDARQTGTLLGGMFLAAIVSNPLFGALSDRGPLRLAAILMVLSSGTVMLFPLLPKAGVTVALAVYGFFFLANYPVVEAALMTSVPVKVRGQVMGLIITVSGVIGSLAHWQIGDWVQVLPSFDRMRFAPLFGTLATLMVVSLLALPLLKRIRTYAVAHHVGEEWQGKKGAFLGKAGVVSPPGIGEGHGGVDGDTYDRNFVAGPAAHPMNDRTERNGRGDR